MAKVAKAYQSPSQTISTSRATKSVLITILGLILLIGLGYHLYWAVMVFVFDRYGDSISNIVFGFGTLILNGTLSFKLLTFLNEKYIDSDIDADHKKYL